MDNNKTTNTNISVTSIIEALAYLHLAVTGLCYIKAKETGQGKYGDWYRFQIGQSFNVVTFYTDKSMYDQITEGEIYSFESGVEQEGGTLKLVKPVFTAVHSKA
ncbi:MAG: hypothetical protein P9L97_01425 [Candidatus Tenebribacter davisii]|nr:hypothetical protein [Candidatus Tenebribacter davisii]